MYKIGYYMTSPIDNPAHIEINEDHIDFNKYKVEQIFYIVKMSKTNRWSIKNPKGITDVCLYSIGQTTGDVIETPNTLIDRYSSNNKDIGKYEPLTLYDKQLIYMFNNPVRKEFDEYRSH